MVILQLRILIKLYSSNHMGPYILIGFLIIFINNPIKDIELELNLFA